MSRVSRRQAALLAALMDADGGVVSYAALGRVVGSGGVNDRFVVQQYVYRIRAAGADCIEVLERAGARMVCLPPDWALEDVLAMLRSMRRHGFEHAEIRRWREAS